MEPAPALTLIAALVFTLVAAEARAQDLPPLQPGARVRVTLPLADSLPPVTGSLVLLEPLRFTVAPVGEVRTVPFAFRQVERLEVSIGPSPLLRVGTVLGGVVFGAWLGHSGRLRGARCRVVSWRDGCQWETAPWLVGAGGGFILSALAARFLIPERWRTIPIRF